MNVGCGVRTEVEYRTDTNSYDLIGTADTVTVTQYDGTGFVGTFSITLDSGDTITGDFSVTWDIEAYEP